MGFYFFDSLFGFNNPSISRMRWIRLGWSNLISGAGTRLCFIFGGTCLWCGKVLASFGSFGWGWLSYQEIFFSFNQSS